MEATRTTLDRWENHGGIWRTLSVTSTAATIELCSCTGEPAEQVSSSDPSLLAYLAHRPRSDQPEPGLEDCEAVGMASFPASDPPSSWTWDVGAPR